MNKWLHTNKDVRIKFAQIDYFAFAVDDCHLKLQFQAELTLI